MWALQTRVGRGLVCRLPALHVAQQEIGQAGPGRIRRRSVLGGVVPRECELGSIDVAPGRRVAIAHQHFHTEMQDVPATDEGEYVGRIIEVLDVDGVRAGRQAVAAGATALVDVNRRENAGFRILQAQCAGSIELNGVRHKPVALLGICHAEFVHQRRTDCPGVGELHVVAVNVAGEAVNRARKRSVFVDAGIVFLAD